MNSFPFPFSAAALAALAFLPGSASAQSAGAAAPKSSEPAASKAVVAYTGRPPEARDALMAQFYSIEEVKGPKGVDSQVGAMAALPDGRLAVAFHRGEVAFLDPGKGEWSLFAEGLHEPLGICAEKDGSILVMQRPELTRLRDTKGQGKADVYETVWDGFGMTGNYHEFCFGPLPGKEGKVFVGLNLASSGASIRPEIRGKWLPIGLERKEFYGDWKKNGKLAGRMYSRVPWRGWVMEVDLASGKATPFASGFRSPDGLGLDAEGNLLASDNQGDWRGSSELHVVQKGGFYGHPASLPWKADWGDTQPLEVPLEKLEQLRTPAAVWFPHAIYANSPTQMVVIPKTTAWGPYGGQVVIGEMNVPRLLRVTLQKVGGVWQGACYPFIETKALHEGLHRLAFVGDRLWVGRTHLSWAGGEHLSSVEPKGGTPFDPLEVRVTPQGFSVRFTKPVGDDALQPAQWGIRSYTYAYHKEYGSPRLQEVSVVPEKISVSADGCQVDLTLAELREHFVYDFDLHKLRSRDGEELLNTKVAYTLRKKP